MTGDLTKIEQTAEVSAELANSYVIGAMTTAAGLPGGDQLQTDSASLLADLGIDIMQPTESGVAAAAVVGIRAALAGNIRAVGTSLAKNPKQWAVALGIATAAGAASVGLYDWMTEDQQIAMEQIRQDAAVKAQALASLPPEDRQRVAEILAKQQPRLGTSVPAWPFLLAGGAVAAYFVWKNKAK
jgi:hypothetical protein